MIPTHSIQSCDCDSFYQHYWPSVKACWNRIGVVPVRVMVGKDWQKPEIVKEKDCILVFLPCGEKHPVATYAQFGRLWYAASDIPNRNDVLILNDMDMLPVSKRKLVDQFKDILHGRYVYYENVEWFYQKNKPTKLTTCHNITTANKFKNLFVGMNPEDFVGSIDAIVDNELKYDGKVFDADEHYLSRCVLGVEDYLVVPRQILSGGYRPDRLEGRDIWQYDNPGLREPAVLPYIERLRSGEIVDVHCKRPFDENAEHIEELVETILAL